MHITDFKCKGNIWTLTFKPSIIEKIFGVKEKQKSYKETNRKYTFGGGTIYVTQDGRDTDNGDWVAEAIDRKKRSF